ncbi:MAG: ABC transporter ATP-binding protein [Actinobacteria bacterium]|nr:ABC transporter ATP-binding protein [Actinomycetota bacterium]
MLEVHDLVVSYDSLQVLWGVSIQVPEDSFVSIIGSNGAGKTTLLRTISGLKKPESGSIVWNGMEISGMKPDEICGLGIIHVPEGRHIFPNMTVLENLKMGAYLPENRRRVNESLSYVFEKFPILAQRKSQYAGTMSGGEQQMLAIARALMSRPKLLMLDEPSLGLSPKMAANIFRQLESLSGEEGLSILLVSQEQTRALSLSDKAYVMENGRIMREAPGEDLLKDESVRKHYLGL